MVDKRPVRNHPSPNSQSGAPKLSWPLIEKVLAYPTIRTTYLWGPPGVGKTFAAIHKAGASQLICACTLTEEMSANDLRGSWMPDAEGFGWFDGPVAKAMREGGRIVLNEITRASHDIQSFLYGVMESIETARITLPNRETLIPAPGFEVVACDNAPPDELPEGLRDRFDAVLEVREPHPEALALLSPDLREAALRGSTLEHGRRASLRGFLKVDQLRADFGLEVACVVVFGAERGSQLYDALVLGGVST